MNTKLFKQDPLWAKLSRYRCQNGCPVPRSKKRRIRNKWIKRNLISGGVITIPFSAPMSFKSRMVTLSYIDDVQPTPEVLALQKKAVDRVLTTIGDSALAEIMKACRQPSIFIRPVSMGFRTEGVVK